MELSQIKNKATTLFKRYKYPLLVLLIGLLLMILPNKSDEINNNHIPQITSSENDQAQMTEQRLSEILSQIQGAGNVSVMLMEGAGEEILYQENQTIGQDSKRTDTVTVTDAQRSQSGLVRQVNPAKYAGAIVVCDGAGDPEICLQIVNAVSCVTGLGSNRISVLKMK